MSRSNTHANTSLPFDCWPCRDRDQWLRACEPRIRLERGGRLGHLARVSRQDLERRYGYFLSFVQRSEPLSDHLTPAAYVTPARVQAYFEHLQRCVSSVTLAGNIRKLHSAAKALDPSQDFGWLAELALDLEFIAEPKDKRARIRESHVLVEAGLSLFQGALLTRPSIVNARMARDGLMIALLAHCPIRLKNFANLTITRSFRREGEHWTIILAAKDTKSRRADERPVPTDLTPYIESYLERFRPLLLGSLLEEERGTDPGALWISRQTGRRMSYSGVERAIIARTQEALGIAVSPHLFRCAAASTLAVHAGQDPHLASALLQHTDARITEMHYNRASSVHAVQAYARLIQDLR
ncbi:site-specific integrase [Alsobacter metallidurans]|uniref:site-specific integrase n=1 Tax=Alsobacter metallidurans TaxID=340221 RepID=UPI001667AE65|nr:site-specific integrase [Alsobacter metallidurans]